MAALLIRKSLIYLDKKKCNVVSEGNERLFIVVNGGGQFDFVADFKRNYLTKKRLLSTSFTYKAAVSDFGLR